MNLKQRIEKLEQGDNEQDHLEGWGVCIAVGAETRTYAHNKTTGEESQDPEFVHQVSTYNTNKAKRLGIREEFVVIVGTPETGQHTYQNGELVHYIPELGSEMVPEAEIIARPLQGV